MFRENSHKILIVVPAWNEEQSIAGVLKELKVACPHFDIIVINDGSNDSTGHVIADNGVRVINHNTNSGYAAAIQSGRIYALENNYDFLVFIDADGQHKPSDVVRVLEPVVTGLADQVRGSRELGKYEGSEPLYLGIARWICSTLTSLKTRMPVTDVTSGFKSENRSITQYFRSIYNKSNKIHLSNTNDIEEHLLAHKNSFRLMEVPVVMCSRENGSTKCYRLKDLITFPLDLIRTFWRNW